MPRLLEPPLMAPKPEIPSVNFLKGVCVMYNVVIRGEVSAIVPDMDKLAENVPLPTLPVRMALPPPSNDYWASIAPTLRMLYSVIDRYSKVDWRSWDEEDRLDAMSHLNWANEWLRWYREESFKLRNEYAELIERANRYKKQ